ncbi:MAG: hypothetical protein GY739_16480, partial [Mesoflavibacter sp.]|nr:hypothetical protein [Mesoflavibacter sp.]
MESLEQTLREESQMEKMAFLRSFQVSLTSAMTSAMTQALTECFQGAISQISNKSGVSLGDNETGPEGISGGVAGVSAVGAGVSAVGAVNLGAENLGVSNNSTVPPANLGPQQGSYGYDRITNHNDRISTLVNDRNRSRNMGGTVRGSANVSAGRNRPGNLDLFVVHQSADNVQVIKNWVVNRVEWENSEFHHRTVLVPEGIDNLNSINMFEGGQLQPNDIEWCKRLSIIKPRSILFGEMDHFKMVEIKQKMDERFRTGLPEFTVEDQSNLTEYLDRVWVVAGRHMLEDHHLGKEYLYSKLSDEVRNMTGHALKPGYNMGVTFKNYMVKIKTTFEPTNSREIAKDNFEMAKQQSNDKIEMYLERKKRLFDIAYGFTPRVEDMSEFYKQFIAGLRSPALANDLRNFVIHMTLYETLMDYDCFRKRVLLGAHSQVDAYKNGQTSDRNIVGCESYSYGIIKGVKKFGRFHEGHKNNPIVVNQVEYFNQKGGENGTDLGDDSEIYFSDSDDFYDDQVIGALNQRDRVLVCWYCNKPNHVISTCFDKQNNRPPHPNGKWAKTRATFK